MVLSVMSLSLPPHMRESGGKTHKQSTAMGWICGRASLWFAGKRRTGEMLWREEESAAPSLLGEGRDFFPTE